MKRSKHIAAAFIALVLSILCVCSSFAATNTEVDADTANDALITGMGWVSFLGTMSDDDLQYFVDNSDSEDLESYFPGFVNIASGVQSYITYRDELGEYVGVKETTTSADDENVYANLVLEYENRDVEVVVGLDREMTQYTKFTFEPVYSFGEKMSNAALNLVVGMVTVFAVLILLMFIIDSFKYIHQFEEKQKNKKAAAKSGTGAAAPASPAAASAVAAPAAQAMDDAQLVAVIAAAAQAMEDEQLVAVITAAIAAYEGTTTDGLVVRSIKRASDNKWRRR